MSIRNYRDLQVWQKAMDFVVAIYQASDTLPSEERYGLTSQLRRAAVSVPANIAEGSARQGSKELMHHLSIAQGSLGELDTLVRVGTRLGYFKDETSDTLLEPCAELGRMATGLRASLSRRDITH